MLLKSHGWGSNCACSHFPCSAAYMLAQSLEHSRPTNFWWTCRRAPCLIRSWISSQYGHILEGLHSFTIWLSCTTQGILPMLEALKHLGCSDSGLCWCQWTPLTSFSALWGLLRPMYTPYNWTGAFNMASLLWFCSTFYRCFRCWRILATLWTTVATASWSASFMVKKQAESLLSSLRCCSRSKTCSSRITLVIVGWYHDTDTPHLPASVSNFLSMLIITVILVFMLYLDHMWAVSIF